MHRTVRGLLLIALLVGLLAACGPQALGPEETASAFLQAMANQEFAEAHKLLSPDSQASVTAEDFQRMLTDSWKSSDISAIQVKSVEKVVLSHSGTRASVPYEITITTTDGETADIFNALSLVFHNGQWGVIWPPLH